MDKPQTRKAYIYVTAMAQHVHAQGLRHKATGRVRDAETRYDRVLKNGFVDAEETHDGNIRLVSADGSLVFNVRPQDEGTLFRYHPRKT
jgi:hypothetical protein